MAKRITKDEEMAILKAIQEGSSISKVSKEFNRGKASISRILKKNKIKTERSKTKKATEAKQFYSKQDRMNLLKQGFEKAADMLRNAEAFRDLKDWSMAVAILIDKQRLEEGEPTEITKGKMENTNNNYHEIDLDELPIEVVRKIVKSNVQRGPEKESG